MVGLLGIGLTLLLPPLRWRGEVLLLKAQGELPDVDWTDLIRMARPHSRANLKALRDTRSPYVSLTNPWTTPADVEAGAAMFRKDCARCHDATGTGGTGPELTRPAFRHGGSDWALYRTISRGVPGTGMTGIRLDDRGVWQLVAFVRSLSSGDSASRLATSGSRSTTPNAPYEHLLHPSQARGAWLTYSGSYDGQRHSELHEITARNVGRLRPQWLFQLATANYDVETTPLVAGGTMFITDPSGTVRALDARTGELLWTYWRPLPDRLPLCCGTVNRGVAILDSTIYVATLDAHLVAVDAATGALRWDVPVAASAEGYSMTSAPLALRGKIVVGVAGGEYGIRGFIAAYDAATGRQVWRFHTVPGPGEPGHESWGGDSWKTGGAPTWLTGTFDPTLDLIYWGVGNPNPDFNGDERLGDNLYSNSVVALDAGTGRLRWHFQFTPHDEHDWDAAQIPVLVDGSFRGKPRKLLLWANRNGFYYVLDRTNGRFLLARPFATQTWAEGIDSSGRPTLRAGSQPSAGGTIVSPGTGATNWWSPSYSPRTGLVYVPVLEDAALFYRGPASLRTGGALMGSASNKVSGRPWQTFVRALDAETGELRWEYARPKRMTSGMIGGLLSTAGGLVFGGDSTGFFALDARTGRVLWWFNTGGLITAAPITYLSDGHQRVTIAAGRAILTFGLE